jgi:hypothetical protein
MRRKKILKKPEGFHPFPPEVMSQPTSPKLEDNEKPGQAIPAVQSSYQQFTKSLTEIIREEPWKKRGYSSIKAFCSAELTDIDYTTLIRHKKAMAVHERLEPGVSFGIVPAYVYREILKVDDEDQAQVWALAKQLAGRLSKVRPQHLRKALTELDTVAKRDRPVSKAGMIYEAAVGYLVNSSVKVFGSSQQVDRKLLRCMFSEVLGKVG